MSCILFYSNYCEKCKRLLSILSKNDTSDIHFVGIDKRKQYPDGSIKAILDGNTEFLIPDNITSVPSLILMTRGYRIVGGVDDILEHLRPVEMVNHKFSQPQQSGPVSDPSTWNLGGGTTRGGGEPDRRTNDQFNQSQQATTNSAAYKSDINTTTDPSPVDPSTTDPSTTDPSPFGSWDTAGVFGVVSDFYSFLDQSSDSLMATGDGGVRQMYNYASINMQDEINTPIDTYAPDTIGSDVSVDKLVQQRSNV